MIVTQVYNPFAFACYQMGRPQSILMRIYLDILKCTYYVLNMYFRQFFLKSMYFSSWKISENQESVSLTVLNEVLPYTGLYNDSPYSKGFIAAYICLCDDSHICCLWTEKDPIWFCGTKENIKLAAWTLHCFSAIKLNQYFVKRWCCQWHEEDLSDSLTKDTKWKVMVILWYWTLQRLFPH